MHCVIFIHNEELFGHILHPRTKICWVYFTLTVFFTPAYSGPAPTMVLTSNISVQKTLYEVLSVSEDATYDEIRAAYRSAALNTHPDKAQTTLESSSVPSTEQQEFSSVQKAWEVLRHPTSRADYDKQLQSSRQSIEIIASEIQVGDMIVESAAGALELLYPCRCGDYFSITSGELSGMGIVVTGDGEEVEELQALDSASASVVLGCGSCSLKIRLVIDGTS
jgi:diphthamide biosynthesis protein 4